MLKCYLIYKNWLHVTVTRHSDVLINSNLYCL